MYLGADYKDLCVLWDFFLNKRRIFYVVNLILNAHSFVMTFCFSFSSFVIDVDMEVKKGIMKI